MLVHQKVTRRVGPDRYGGEVKRTIPVPAEGKGGGQPKSQKTKDKTSTVRVVLLMFPQELAPSTLHKDPKASKVKVVLL